MKKISVIGAGAWGTGLAMAARRAGLDVVMWALETEVAEAINTTNENSVYLPGVRLDKAITATNDIVKAAKADTLLLTVPTQFLRGVCENLAPTCAAAIPTIICAKGIERKTSLLPSEVVGEILPQSPLGVLSGPTFAIEVAQGLPTAVTLACNDETLGKSLAGSLATPTFRIYLSPDVIGAQIGGAVKNVLAIACGIVQGRHLGDNARAAIITRGMAEIKRLSIAKGGKAETLMGLSGLGDMVLTCTATQSRNYSLGMELGQGEALKTIIGQRRSVAEGVFSASSVCAMARELSIDMPICEAINNIINDARDIDTSIAALLGRPFKSE